ncbi:MAG: DUF3781 domain-containing protein [Rickettsiales bacterium]|nr:DUF3781 domain-containing protein [Rickettsiales bacterium]
MDKIIDNLHTTPMGQARVRRNIGIANDADVIDWARSVIAAAPESAIVRRGKNWYIAHDKCILTVNARSHTLITAHKEKESK